MNSIEKIYEPYNFSKTSCHVFTKNITAQGYEKIEYKLPEFIHILKDIFICVDCKDSTIPIVGFISLSFNGQASKSYLRTILTSISAEPCIEPFPLNEPIKPNSFMQGGYFGFPVAPGNFPYQLSVYLHYSPPIKP